MSDTIELVQLRIYIFNNNVEYVELPLKLSLK